MTARSFSTPPSKGMSQPVKNGQVGPARKSHTTKGRPKGSRNLGRKAYPTTDQQREIRFKVLTHDNLFDGSRSPISPADSSPARATEAHENNTPDLSARSVRSSTSYSSPFLPSQHNRASSTDGFPSRVDGFSTQSPETCYSEDLFSHFDQTSASMNMEYYSAPTSAGDQTSVDLSSSYPHQWDGSQPSQQWQFDSWLSGLSIDGLDAKNVEVSSEAAANGDGMPRGVPTEQASGALNYMMGIQREIHHLTSLIIPEATKELAQAKSWQKHCLELYEESSRRVRQVEEKMASIRQQYEAKLATAASTKQDLNGLLSVHTTPNEPPEAQKLLPQCSA